jgi:hypothetical protein
VAGEAREGGRLVADEARGQGQVATGAGVTAERRPA